MTSRLATVHSLPSWAEEKEKDEVQGWGEQGDGGWDYDTVPQPYMTQVSYIYDRAIVMRVGSLLPVFCAMFYNVVFGFPC